MDEEKKVIEFALDFIMEFLKCDSGTYFSVNENKKILTFDIVKGPSKDVITGVSFKYEGIAGWCAENKRNIIVRDVSKNPEFTYKVDYATGYKTRSIIAVSLTNKDKIKGVFEFINPLEKNFFDNEDLELIELIVNIISLKINWN